ncbi:MAG: Phage P1-like protein [Parcubacteria group bacterium GW2011_GWA2_43_11]|nr:MAG: Phage P1-like protein [Parcubacteria group bacterium GW2011_GWC2_42_11]KKS85683.1 MAG: Phage P1-like protein [Parcubacteria group bacterium GW2011_GWA2_43_11]
MKDFTWLPPLITLGAHNGDVIFYMDTLYQAFLNDLVNLNCTLLGKPVYVSRKLEVDGRYERFWHIITDPHSPRTQDIQHLRAEKIPWIKAVIDNFARPEVLAYEIKKDRDLKLYLYIPEQEFMVILVDKGKEYHFVTAYHIRYSYMLRQYDREYRQYGPKIKV